MTGRELIRWSALHDRRARGALRSPAALAVAGGVLLAAWVAVRLGAGRALSGPGGLAAASHAWLGAALATAAVAFLRVPFLVYWRSDAAFLAQLPLEGGVLVDAALWRCMRAALATTAALAIGALPLVAVGGGGVELLLRHLAFAGALGVAAGAAMPAVALYIAGFVADERDAARVGAATQTPPTALLGAGPGFVATAILATVAAASPWLDDRPPAVAPALALGGVVAAGVVMLAGARVRAARLMAKILRDVSALDRQRLATLEIAPPTALERAVAGVLGDAALVYRKDAVLMRRRFPMAYALGGLAFVVLVVVGLARPGDPMPYLVTVLAGLAVYGVVLAGRLGRAPIELPRLAETLPIADGVVGRARVAWVVTWTMVFAVVPAGIALALLQR